MNRKIRKILAFALLFLMIFTVGCGDSGKTESAEPLSEVNTLPEDGIITKAQFKTVAGEDMTVSFQGETEDGITYTWAY